MRWLDGITNAVDVNFGKLWEKVRVKEAWRTKVHGGCNELGTLTEQQQQQ